MAEPDDIDLSDLKMRRARLSDADLLSNWGQRPHVLAATGGQELDWRRASPRDVSWREIWIAELFGRPVGVGIVIDAAREETHYWGDLPAGTRALDIWLGEVHDTGRGIGSAFLLLLLGQIFDDPTVTHLFVDPLISNARAIRFYQRFGFRSLGPRMLGNDHCEVLELYRHEGLLAQLRAMEPVFHRLPIRGFDRTALEPLIDRGFWEIGASGKVYERDFVIKTLLERGPDHPERKMICSEYRLRQICADVFQIGYLLEDDGNLSWRTSLWRRKQGRWLLLFHQGTMSATTVAS